MVIFINCIIDLRSVDGSDQYSASKSVYITKILVRDEAYIPVQDIIIPIQGVPYVPHASIDSLYNINMTLRSEIIPNGDLGYKIYYNNDSNKYFNITINGWVLNFSNVPFIKI